MKSIGMVRKVDSLGRVVIPIELRKSLGINVTDQVEIFVDGDKIVFRKYNPFCTFCQSDKNIVNYEGKVICKSCMEKIIKLQGKI